jgi:PAS domain S-box-containing protein
MSDEIQTTILDSITEGVFTIDLDFHITSFNRAAQTITGITREQAMGMYCKDILRANICEGRCALHQTLRTGKPVLGKTVVILDTKGNRKPISITTALLRNGKGDVIGGVETFRDLTMIEELRKEIETLRSPEARFSWKAKAARERSSLPGPSTLSARERKGRLSRSTAPPFPTPSWNQSSSATKRAHSPTREKTHQGGSLALRGGSCFLTR